MFYIQADSQLQAVSAELALQTTMVDQLQQFSVQKHKDKCNTLG